jgi:hypothetical protein
VEDALRGIVLAECVTVDAASVFYIPETSEYRHTHLMSLHAWRLTWGGVATKLFAQVASFASLLGLLVALVPSGTEWPWWAKVLMSVAVVSFLAVVWLVVASRPKHRVFEKTDVAGIRRYMHDWIRDGGRVAIWTRDMSWADNPDTRRVLAEKARRRELVLCLPELNELASELRDMGAEVCTYGAQLLESPASRFTIAFLGRDGSQVAVGRAEGRTHVIDEFTAGDHPVYHLAADMVALVRALQRV